MTSHSPQDPYPSYPPGQRPVPPKHTQEMFLADLTGGGTRGRGLGPGQKAAVIVGVAVMAVLLLCGGLGTLGAIVDASSETPGTKAPGTKAPGTRAPGTKAPGPTSQADGAAVLPSAAESPSASASPTTAPSPTVETKAVTETRAIPFGKRTVRDSSLAEGTRKVRTRGVAGVKTLTYEVTVTDGVETAKRLVREAVTRAPVTEVTAIGTRKTRKCDPNYGGCVPIASDVDCAGGSGNGPAYVSGPVKVIGSDVYDLDRDGDGYGCDD